MFSHELRVCSPRAPSRLADARARRGVPASRPRTVCLATSRSLRGRVRGRARQVREQHSQLNARAESTAIRARGEARSVGRRAGDVGLARRSNRPRAPVPGWSGQARLPQQHRWPRRFPLVARRRPRSGSTLSVAVVRIGLRLAASTGRDRHESACRPWRAATAPDPLRRGLQDAARTSRRSAFLREASPRNSRFRRPECSSCRSSCQKSYIVSDRI